MSNFNNRCLGVTIDSATLKAGHKQSTGRAGTFGVLLFTLSVCGLLLWADRYFY